MANAGTVVAVAVSQGELSVVIADRLQLLAVGLGRSVVNWRLG